MVPVMDLDTFFKSGGSRKALADQLKVSPNYLWQIATRNPTYKRQPGVTLAKRIHEATLGVVTLESLRPDVWGNESHH
jgi:DNA-binding transcriptional regulator YdaS (Cro superfamily)